LAEKGRGLVSPNPMVGAVLVHEGRIIGEGWHRRWGEAHAEVNCLLSVRPADRALLPHSTLYCSLEPCSHVGKTPPCADLLIREKIGRVVVSNTDPNPQVAGKGLSRLRAAGIEVLTGVLEAEGRWLNRAFFTWMQQQRPHIILKWAQSRDGYLARPAERTPITGPLAQRLVHRWRGEADAILVGTRTALTDNPRLDTRLFSGKNPLRVTIDRSGLLPAAHHLLDGSMPTWVYGQARPRPDASPHPPVFKPLGAGLALPELLSDLAQGRRAILLVEGGADLLGQFLAADLWDELRVLENPALYLGAGVAAPALPAAAQLRERLLVGADEVRIFSAGQGATRD
ncbi:MAG TPA: bifunctional diaminohydroxyphosphoribosylaminopyrimidine deaminase/5-amino-6-(5-phosphoribosylamino)uracil reductase RibD, partial [Saprospiraceae bacterium]|nr:bifunctional diaminohydroxyphosphoribosylaminopyrimidine deaminase/5-amino-6-(5-phosphoribosylamino)uracil reductase RibD [Saprospiraceae bacterium]